MMNNHRSHTSAEELELTEIQWSKYAEHYDQMCEVNPSYAEMIGLVVENALSRPMPRVAQVLDIGAGTGNLIASLAPQRPSWNFVHLDYDSGMNEKARRKYSAMGLENITIVEQAAEHSDFKPSSFDLILTTNAIYTIPGYISLLSKFNEWLNDDGSLIAVDFGRPQDTTDWMLYIARNLVRKKGLFETYRIFKKNWEAAKQNRRTTAAQQEGNYWVHDTLQFRAALESVGFHVESSKECYRGYSDIAVCTK